VIACIGREVNAIETGMKEGGGREGEGENKLIELSIEQGVMNLMIQQRNTDAITNRVSPSVGPGEGID